MSVSREHSHVRVADLVRVGWSGVRTRPLRAVLAALGIAIAIATVVTVMSVPASSRASFEQRIDALGADTLRIDAAPGERAVVLPASTIAQLERIGPISAAATMGRIDAEVRSSALRPDADGAIVVQAVDGPLIDILRATAMAGAATPTDGAPEAVLGATAAERLGITGVDGRVIDVGGLALRVVGILDPVALSGEVDASVLVGTATATSLLAYDGHPTVAYARADRGAIPELGPVIGATLAPSLGALIRVTEPSAVLAAHSAATDSFDGLSLGLAAVAIVIGGIGIANTMLVAVLERRHEIGVRRALGARRRDVATQFLLESCLLATGGGVAGAAVGGLATAAWALANGWPVVVPPWVVLTGIVIATLCGIVAGIVPATRAAQQSPASSLAGS